MRTAVLLGAGASADAGLPMTHQLAERLLRQVKSRREFPQSRKVAALNFVYSAMLAHRGESGGSPLEAVNVERLYSAVRLLGSREDHEVAPFVASWKAGVGAFDAEEDYMSEHNVKSAFDALTSEHFPSARQLRDVIKEIAQSVFRSGDGSVYRELEVELLHATREILVELGDVSYLAPLMELARSQDGGLDIATLNYDLTVETAATQASIRVNTGIESWSPGKPLDFTSDLGTLNLYKLHGSVDWVRDHHRPDRNASVLTIAGPVVRKTGIAATSLPPAIVIGDREKLGGDGPTLSLMNAFERALDNADRLVVVGYSFGDTHINAMVRNWVNVDPTRTLSVLDPSWAGTQGNSFQASLAWGLRQIGSHTNDVDVTPRLHVVRERTADGLSRVLTELPVAEPKEPLKFELIKHPGQRLSVKAQNTGSELRELSISASIMTDEAWSSPLNLTLRADGEESDYVRLKRPLLRGENIELEVVSDVPPTATGIQIRAGAHNTFERIDWSTTLGMTDEAAA